MATPINGGTTGLWIDPHQVGKAAAAADKVAEDIPGDIKGLFKTTDAAVTGLAGFESAPALDECLEAWTKALRALAGLVGGAADAVRDSNNSFADEDRQRRNAFLGPYAPGAEPPDVYYTPHTPDLTTPPSANGGR
ncbi:MULTISPECIES: hypothetical protein [unclassified Streptomyces]|uniref:hypothetical protein n=1 Tax=unclassified Streptomyces TaxID=2593676 RepID=UPI002ED6B362|nr:hypothetical protein OH827_12115 [Streptomyces sp. NBC_00891]WSY05710.1 hypothetical protein OG464_12115 [Streptomyces sp. NBC_00890]WSZ07334.1 hypothetical protein OG704_12115 [Streptomyces sp. NBC_00869]WSZ25167.1 hypothetical protein OG498_21450 [Streptomyces sp. NBC_00870]